MLQVLALLAAIEFRGNFTQGGMVEAFAPAGTVITVNGEKADCYGVHCLIGFNRDFPETANITVRYPNTAIENYTIPIRQVKYDIQHITLESDEKIKPNKANKERMEKEAIEVATKRVESLTSSQPCPNYFYFKRPAPGLITGWFGSQRIYNDVPRAPHSGVDFKGAIGDPITAPEGGTVILVEDLFLTGHTMVIDHGCGVTSTYLHLDGSYKKVGDKVKQGELIAAIGNTGLATGPHLHWGISLGTTRLDPLQLLK